jgi:hypothetical protein
MNKIDTPIQAAQHLYKVVRCIDCDFDGREGIFIGFWNGQRAFKNSTHPDDAQPVHHPYNVVIDGVRVPVEGFIPLN